ncbi:hypothetical protein M4914_12500 [Streptomyces somaliensis DSM 40738]|uniref:Isopenicillin N synthase family oxygenase n=1 Tax=Streptomyces somaliensis (strain ATCC 33201 / DSM 40738 / JCM 12659 / KCTC 9044 / NCTC 11332 / NRRL B-12077 / IP 733) TaxID=1134445 RepID=A0AA44IC76_STRE0|nr:2OG-Fe(II) oxygenase family protein [Streptomyces somaliensis]MCQ0023687.1 hypothetical protein [Streptomyces somaliensis DSM 40738]NKY13117.1 isopenicillin N synthase family oxygenase [Streptomyces somaliensis DSM 40738]
MAAASRSRIPEIHRGKIYQDLYEQRSPGSKSQGEARLEKAYVRPGPEASETETGSLVFEDAGARARAFRDGVFLLRIPDGLDVGVGDRFAAQFHRGPGAMPYGRFRDIRSDRFDDPLLGFHQRVDQIEQFLLESRFWTEHYPSEVTALGQALTRLARTVLRSVLAHAGIPREDWRRATGGCSEACGSYHLTFNHYRPTRPDIGLSSHKDDGFLTILRTTTPGLEVYREGRWEAVPVDPDHFVVNFGLSMEILTAGSGTPVAAIMHRVARQDRDRSSFGHFSSSGCLPGEDEGIHRFVRGVGLLRVCGSRELIDENDHEIYAGTDAPVLAGSGTPARKEDDRT